MYSPDQQGDWQGRGEREAYQRPGPPYRDPRYQQPGARYAEPRHGEPRYQPAPPPEARHAGRGTRHGADSGRARSGGAAGNERLTAMTGAVLLILLAAEGLTILRIGRLLTLHFFLGMLLLGPVALKAGSTTYRFFRYYTGDAQYRRKGPPALLLRLLGPFIMLLTLTVFGSGVALAFTGPGRGIWLLVHKGSFILWFCAMTVHVLAYLPRLPRLLAAEARVTARDRSTAILGGRGMRMTLLIASLLAGLVIAMLTVHLAGPWQFLGRH